MVSIIDIGDAHGNAALKQRRLIGKNNFYSGHVSNIAVAMFIIIFDRSISKKK